MSDWRILTSPYCVIYQAQSIALEGVPIRKRYISLARLASTCFCSGCGNRWAVESVVDFDLISQLYVGM